MYRNAQVITVCARKNFTFELTKKIKNKHFHTFYNINDQGKGHALWNGVKKTKRKYICNIDADEQFYPQDIKKMYYLLKKNKKLHAVHASRFMEKSDRKNYNDGKFRIFGNYLMSFIVTVLTLNKVTDVAAGLKIWNRKFLVRNEPLNKRFFYDIELIIVMYFKNLKFKELPVSYRSRSEGQSLMGDSLLSLASRGARYIGWGVMIYILNLFRIYRHLK